jgi:HPt (histidine-containing phosphotransfer) domain-containing protein
MAPPTVLDFNVLADLRELGGDKPQGLLDELFVMLFATAKSQLAEIRHAAEIGDLNTLIRAAHTLKGGAGSVGAAEVAALAGVIESGARQGSYARWEEWTEELQAALLRLRVAAIDQGLKTTE